MKLLTSLAHRYRVRKATAAGLVVIHDAVDVSAIPSNAATILAYIDGGYVTLGEVQVRFPNARILTVTTNGRNRADICDVESGDATPAVAAQGVRDGLYVNVYSDESTKPDLDQALAGLGWNWYCAAPGTSAQLQPGSVATQFAWPGYGSPGNYDVSVADPNWLNGPGPSPTPTPTPSTAIDFLQELLAMTDNGAIVRMSYILILDRRVDGAGYTSWVNFLNGGGTVNDFLAALGDSPEGVATLQATRKSKGLDPAAA